MVKRVFVISGLILIGIIILSIFYSFKFIDIRFQSIIGNEAEINQDIVSTKITKISESTEEVIYRYSWKTSESSPSTCKTIDYKKLELLIPDIENTDTKITTNLLNQFDVETKNIVFNGIKSFKNPCIDSEEQAEVSIKNQKAVCDLVIEDSKPIISCVVDAEIYPSHNELNTFYGNVNGYADIKFKK